MLFLLVQSSPHLILSQLYIVLHSFMCFIKPSTQICAYYAEDVFEVLNSFIRSAPLTTFLKESSKAP